MAVLDAGRGAVRAWRVHELGEPIDVMRLDDVDDPEPSPGTVRIDVSAAALNFPDALLCQGRYQERPDLPLIPGLELAGLVSAVGDGVTRAAVGQRVAAMPLRPSGGLAERVIADENAVFAVPDSMSDAAAASLLITYQTGWFGLHRRAALQPGEWLLVHAGAGGVGSAAIQLGRAAGARVIATAGGPEKVEVCRRLGADHVVDYLATDFVEEVKRLTDGHGADVIYDPVGGDVFDRSRKCIAWEGRLVVVGFTSGRIPEIPANHVLLKNYSVVGLHWGNYKLHDPGLLDVCHYALLDLHAEGKIAPLISREVPMEEAATALAAVQHRGSWGKVVVRIG